MSSSRPNSSAIPIATDVRELTTNRPPDPLCQSRATKMVQMSAAAQRTAATPVVFYKMVECSEPKVQDQKNGNNTRFVRAADEHRET